VPVEPITVLSAFDGRSLEQVRQTMATAAHLLLDDGLLRTLVDFELLALTSGSSGKTGLSLRSLKQREP
jgi:hypothetical protein